jgi:hypothetical protein
MARPRTWSRTDPPVKGGAAQLYDQPWQLPEDVLQSYTRRTVQAQGRAVRSLARSASVGMSVPKPGPCGEGESGSKLDPFALALLAREGYCTSSGF